MTAQTPALLNYETLSMTSREVATLTGKRHDNVLSGISKMFSELPDNVRVEPGIYLDSQNREQPEFTLGKELVYTLVSSYDTSSRHAIVKRWLELETEVAQKALDTDLLLRLPPPETQAVWDAGLRVAQTQMNGLMNTKGKKAMIAAVENAVGLNATPAQVVAASLEFYNKNAAKFLKMAQPDARESVRQLRLGH